jgi:adenylyl-sulfate kinase
MKRIHPVTLWFTGLSGAGKSTLALAVRERLLGAGNVCFVLDGDVVRSGLNRDLGYSPADRKENIRRIAEVSRLFNEAGVVTIAALISPYREDREIARAIIGTDRFVETHLAADLETCERRDPKGLYARARKGLIPEFTGISAPYEPPLTPELSVPTGTEEKESCVRQIIEYVSIKYQLLPAANCQLITES